MDKPVKLSELKVGDKFIFYEPVHPYNKGRVRLKISPVEVGKNIEDDAFDALDVEEGHPINMSKDTLVTLVP